MEFFSPVSDIFVDKEFDPVIRRAKHCQLNYSLKKIKEFSFPDDEIIDSLMPENTPAVLKDRRHNIKNINNVKK